MLTAVLAAIGAAALFATAAAFQHRSMRDVDDFRASGLVSFVRRTLRHPAWIIGTVADVAGLGLHVLALNDGALSLVQPLLVTSVVFALALRSLLDHRRPGRRELAWAAALSAGLAVFLVSATPVSGTATTSAPDRWPTVITIAALTVGVGSCLLVSRRRRGSSDALALGVGAGLAFAGTAALIKQSTLELAQGLTTLLTTWPLYALVVVGAGGLLLNQLAFQAGPLRASLPAITTIDPVVSLVIGIAVYDERFRNSPPALLAEALGLAVVVAAAIHLTRSGEPEPPVPRAPSPEPVPG